MFIRTCLTCQNIILLQNEAKVFFYIDNSRKVLYFTYQLQVHQS